MQLEIIVTQKHLSHSAVHQGQCSAVSSARRHSSWAAGQDLCRLSGLVPLGQFPTSGAKRLIFHHWDLHPRGKLKQTLTFEVISPASSSVLWSCGHSGSRAASEVREDGLAQLRAGRLEAGALQQRRGVFWLLTMQWWDWGPSLKCCCWTDVKQDPTCPSLVVVEVASPKTWEMANPVSQALFADALNLTGTNWQLHCRGAQTGEQFAC